MKKSRIKLKGKWRNTIIVVLTMVVLSVFVDQIFISYHRMLNKHFEELLYTNLIGYAETQGLETENYHVGITDTLEAMAVLIQSEDMDPEGEAFQNYLDAYNQKNEDLVITYTSIESLEQALEDPKSLAEDEQVLEHLKAGGSVISQVRKSTRLNGYYYSIAVPVQRQDQVIGVLRSTMDAKELIETEYGSDQIQVLQQYIVLPDGQVVTISEDQQLRDTTIYHGLQDYQLSDSAKAKLQDALEGEETIALELNSKKDEGLFLTCTALQDNGWHEVNIVQADAILQYSDMIMGQTILLGCALMLVALIGGITLYCISIGLRRKTQVVEKQYDLLEQFSDTVLFQYDYTRDLAIITANARERFKVDELQNEHFLQEDGKFLPFHPDDRQKVMDLLRNPEKDAQIRHTEFRLLGKEQRYHWWRYQYQYIYDGDQPARCVGKFTDITDHKERESVLLEQSTTDGLTELLNKVSAENKVKELLKEDAEGTLFLLDLDNFKHVNDTYGHATGDQVLKKFASIIKQFFRSCDVIGRTGGDEFMVYLHGTSNGDIAAEKARLILLCCKRYAESSGMDVGASIGIAKFPEDGVTYETLFKAADDAMYHVKKDGKRNYSFYGEESISPKEAMAEKASHEDMDIKA